MKHCKNEPNAETSFKDFLDAYKVLITNGSLIHPEIIERVWSISDDECGGNNGDEKFYSIINRKGYWNCENFSWV